MPYYRIVLLGQIFGLSVVQYGWIPEYDLFHVFALTFFQDKSFFFNSFLMKLFP